MNPTSELLMALTALALETKEAPTQEAREEPPAYVPHYATEKDALIFAAKLAKAAPGDVVVCAEKEGKPDRIGVLCGGIDGNGRINAIIRQDGVLALLETSVALVRDVMPLQDYLAAKHSNA